MKIAFNTTLVTLLSFLCSNVCYAQKDKLDYVRVEFEGFYTETIMDVSCEAFSSTFEGTKKVKVFHNEQDLSKFKLLTKDFTRTKNRSFDVRGSIFYGYGKTTTKYCFDTFGYFYKDGKLYYNKKLLIYISDKMYTNHPKYLDTLQYR
jgi:hypothetical protein